MIISQYDIVLVNLEPTIGSEMKKTRPCVVLSPNEMNKFLQTIVIAPITSSSKPYPSRVEIKNLHTTGWIVIDQIRTVDRKRILKCMEKLGMGEIKKVKDIIRETFVD